MFLLDTNICIALLKQDEAAEKRLAAVHRNDVALCSIVKGELLFGARNSERIEQNLRRLDAWLGYFERSLPFDDEAATWYARIRAHLAQSGKPIGGNDLLIASIALAADATVVTRNDREFRRVPGLRVERW